MATTDIDGTPLFILGPTEMLVVRESLDNEAEHMGEWGYEVGPAFTELMEKADKFLNDPQVVQWLKENS